MVSCYISCLWILASKVDLSKVTGVHQDTSCMSSKPRVQDKKGCRLSCSFLPETRLDKSLLWMRWWQEMKMIVMTIPWMKKKEGWGWRDEKTHCCCFVPLFWTWLWTTTDERRQVRKETGKGAQHEWETDRPRKDKTNTTDKKKKKKTAKKERKEPVTAKVCSSVVL